MNHRARFSAPAIQYRFLDNSHRESAACKGVLKWPKGSESGYCIKRLRGDQGRARLATGKPKPHKWSRKSGLIVRSPRKPLSDARLQRALGVLSETKDVKTAARSIRVSVQRFQRTAKRKGTIRKIGGQWKVARRLPRKMPIFSGGRQLAITVNSKSASLIGRYMAAVGQFLKTNDPKVLAEFKGRRHQRRSGQSPSIRDRSQRAVPALIGRRGAIRGNVPNYRVKQRRSKCQTNRRERNSTVVLKTKSNCAAKRGASGQLSDLERKIRSASIATKMIRSFWKNITLRDRPTAAL